LPRSEFAVRSREGAEKEYPEMKDLVRGIITSGLLGLLACSTPLAAQSRLDLSNSPIDVLYSPSPLLEALNQNWAPLTSGSSGPVLIRETPFDIPKENPEANAFIRADTSPFGSNLNATSPIEPGTKAPSDTKIHWGPAIGESLLYTGIMHTFDIATEAGTRDTLNGPWLNNYLHSVGELRGWSDSDTFVAPYIGHPIEGSIFGFILRQNDPRYSSVQWGDGRDYWISVLRSLGYSAVWHTQWKIGPVSEASIGNVMLHASPGFITLVDTPTLGALTMIGEDAADRYLIMGLENRTTNRLVIVFARSFLNPGRSFANMMAFRAPWIRETRLGLSGENLELRKELMSDYRSGLGPKPFEFVKRSSIDGVEFRHEYPKEAPIELSAYPYYESFLGGGNCVGGGGSGAARVSPQLQLVAEVNGCLIMNMPAVNQSGDSLFYGGGARWTPRASHRFSPYAEFLFGGRKVTHETLDAALRTQLLNEWNDGNGTLPHYPLRSDYSQQTSNNGPSIAAGGGLDVVVTRPFAWRLINVQYTHTWMPDVDMIHPQNGVRITTEAVLRIGTW
jgi:hypothetical protein